MGNDVDDVNEFDEMKNDLESENKMSVELPPLS